ncbi:metal-sensitive transcriptional regulator [Streptomyces sp. NL15-2K]|uniref:metal-sensitive transcriptional regulator n=1 Tax=Streptomyces sp. NL15-2K TaxID=376149 RepID=UPI000FF97066|nr:MULTISPECIES: metal-sensitive transcriptional regulator [Actinomycetes]WKX14041.1 metal-sensitive transcriptional regulator [Kutzneria buriramensis]GCB50757.1 repressor csoR of the copZA operon [Streptomyces sp. NL15-2K]
MTATPAIPHLPPPSPRTTHPAPGYADSKADHLARLHKIEGQIRGISRTITDDRYCMDVLTQISAAPPAPCRKSHMGFLDDRVRGCVTDAARTDPAHAEEKFEVEGA